MRLIVVSNRLPFTIQTKSVKSNSRNKFLSKLKFLPSSGGLVTGLTSYLKVIQKSKKDKYLWVGWPGEHLEIEDQKTVKKLVFKKMNALPVFSDQKKMENFYDGFCNKIIWPLFHYFTSFIEFNEDFWNDYKEVNEDFCNQILENYKDGDTIWVHDYHLMLLPKMVRDRKPDAKIGFFLHIPFPSYEVFRLLPAKWRIDLLEGMLGADVIGFQTIEYTQYFLRTVLRILGYEHSLGNVYFNERIIRIDTFPIGIDFQKFNSASRKKGVIREKEELKKSLNPFKKILSLDRLDYTKGLINRLEGYERFLEKNPKWHKKIVLVLILIPSRIKVDQYQSMKKQIEELIGKINGRFGMVGWTPILYQYSVIPFNKLTAFYNLCDVALITPLRDGMNLIAKEYVASRRDKTGVLVLSEMAGASRELGEAISINPNSKEEIATALLQALEMPRSEQIRRNKLMQARLARYDVFRWARNFIGMIDLVKKEQRKMRNKFFTEDRAKELIENYKNAKRRLIFLDYDGTLTPLKLHPMLAKPSKLVLGLLKILSKDAKNEVVMVSGRDKETLEKWFSNLSLSLVAEHGLMIKEKWARWKTLKYLSTDWKQEALNLLRWYTDQLPGSFIEEKKFSLAWHYRKSDPLFATFRAKELVDDLVNFTANKDLHIIHGNKVIEVKNLNANKGTAGLRWFARENFDFVLAIGDDRTDEDLFSVMPENAYSINVGSSQTLARFSMPDFDQVIKLLERVESLYY